MVREEDFRWRRNDLQTGRQSVRYAGQGLDDTSLTDCRLAAVLDLVGEPRQPSGLLAQYLAKLPALPLVKFTR